MTSSDWRVVRHRAGVRRIVIALTAVVVVGALTVGAVVMRGDSDGPARRAAASGPAATSGPAVGSPSAGGVLSADAVAPSPGAALPPPDRVRIPSIGVDSALETLEIDPAGALRAPKDYGRAGWFGGGPAPGDLGPAVVAGHVDSERGPAVFYRLRDLRAGDAIEVARGGTRVAFRVIASERHPKDRFPTDKVYRPTPVPELRLITCGGTFDRRRRSYEDNIVVYAVRVD